MKKIISLLICVVMLFSIGAISVSAEETDTSVALTMQSGAAIRLGEVNGIRFYTIVDTQKVEDLRNAGYTVELGTLISPKNTLGSSELTFQLPSSSYLDVKYTSTVYYSEGSFKGIVGTIANIKEKETSWCWDTGNVTRDFVGRGYAKVTDKDGNVTYSYADYASGSIANNTRSLKTVSSSIVADTEVFNNYDSSIQTKVTKWATTEKVVWSPRY